MKVHIYIRGNYREDIFFDKVDFINAWNRLWISAKETGVQIFVAELLTNHLHVGIMFDGNSQQHVADFIHFFRMSLSAYYNRRYGVSGSLGSRRYGRGVVVDPTVDGGKDMRDLICYGIRNVAHHGLTSDFRSWPYSTYQLLFGPTTAPYTIATLPPNLLYAYFPHRLIPPEWSVSRTGMVVPPDSLFPRIPLKELFKTQEAYEEFCDTPTRREMESDCHERKLGRDFVQPEKPVIDDELIEFVRVNSRVSVVEMDRNQRKAAVVATAEAFPKASLRQLSRIFAVPFSTIKYWVEKSCTD